MFGLEKFVHVVWKRADRFTSASAPAACKKGSVDENGKPQCVERIQQVEECGCRFVNKPTKITNDWCRDVKWVFGIYERSVPMWEITTNSWYIWLAILCMLNCWILGTIRVEAFFAGIQPNRTLSLNLVRCLRTNVSRPTCRNTFKDCLHTLRVRKAAFVDTSSQKAYTVWWFMLWHNLTLAFRWLVEWCELFVFRTQKFDKMLDWRQISTSYNADLQFSNWWNWILRRLHLLFGRTLDSCVARGAFDCYGKSFVRW